jgi:deoxyribodipyrimidine photo-lyase
MNPGGSWGIHWFRRDLRVAGNPALQWSFKQHQGRVVGLFCFDSKFLSREDFSHHRFAFFMETMRKLAQELREAGGDLWVVDCRPQEALERILESLKQGGRPLPSTVSFNRDYEPFARERDAKITEWLQESAGLSVHTERDHLVIEPQEVGKPASGAQFYQVYSPFAKRWFETLKGEDFQARISSQKKALTYLRARAAGKPAEKLFDLTWKQVWSQARSPFPLPPEDALETFVRENSKKVTIEIPEAGSVAAFRRLSEFKAALDAYGDRRDIPSIDGTSKLAMYFKNGSLTPAQVIAFLELETAPLKSDKGATKFLKEIVWREFYYSILWHRPDVEKTAFLGHYRDIAWENRKDWFEAWKEGRTGYPIVDAGMRQLKQTGWMHNRVRMIVASFLTKDLLIDWRWGENHFMKELLDGDLAPNNGGWQWAASTGCDPQPYFRIFNPELQSRRFDPEGEYIRRFVPELSGLDSDSIHAPEAVAGYPAPIVEHHAQKPKALALFKRSE